MTLTYRVDGMSCEHCKVAVTGEVGGVAGVSTVDVDLGTKLVRVSGAGMPFEASTRARACAAMASGRRGPSVIVLPERAS